MTRPGVRRLVLTLFVAVKLCATRAVASAHHGGPLDDTSMSFSTSALVVAGLALAVGALVVVIVAVLTRGRPPRSGPGA